MWWLRNQFGPDGTAMYGILGTYGLAVSARDTSHGQTEGSEQRRHER